MIVARLRLLMTVCVLGLSGCAVLNSRPAASKPQAQLQRAFPLERFVAEHNQNAERIQSLEARPSVGVAGKLTGRADGKLALERPRNFKLELRHLGAAKANIGSNDQEFWFWVQNEKDPSLYYCDYAELESSALPITYQPDWIVEAMGLKTISSAEAAAIRTQPGPERGTTALFFPPVRNKADSYTRVMIVWDHNRRIKEYRILAGDRRTVLAQALIGRYRNYDVGPAASGSGEVCFLPESVRLDWKREQLALEVALQEVKINQFDSSRSAALFVEPTISGYTRVNLAEEAGNPSRESRATVRQTLPAPEPRSGGVKLGRPAPLADDAAIVPRLEKPPGQSSGARATAARPLEDLVGAPSPAAPASDALGAGGALWSRADSTLIER
jgi:hypothetical protein